MSLFQHFISPFVKEQSWKNFIAHSYTHHPDGAIKFLLCLFYYIITFIHTHSLAINPSYFWTYFKVKMHQQFTLKYSVCKLLSRVQCLFIIFLLMGNLHTMKCTNIKLYSLSFNKYIHLCNACLCQEIEHYQEFLSWSYPVAPPLRGKLCSDGFHRRFLTILELHINRIIQFCPLGIIFFHAKWCFCESFMLLLESTVHIFMAVHLGCF